MRRRPRTAAPQPIPLREPGTYLLALALERPRRLVVGRLGPCDFEAGTYLYVGGARGPGGLAARLGHHWRRAARPRWHVDYLRRAGSPLGAGMRFGTEARECRWAARLALTADVRQGPARFGASDCRCGTHLFRFVAHPAERADPLAELADRLGPVLSCEAWLDGCGTASRWPA